MTSTGASPAATKAVPFEVRNTGTKALALSGLTVWVVPPPTLPSTDDRVLLSCAPLPPPLRAPGSLLLLLLLPACLERPHQQQGEQSLQDLPDAG